MPTGLEFRETRAPRDLRGAKDHSAEVPKGLINMDRRIQGGHVAQDPHFEGKALQGKFRVVKHKDPKVSSIVTSDLGVNTRHRFVHSEEEYFE